MGMTKNPPDSGTVRDAASGEASASALRRLMGVVMLGALMMQLDLTMTSIATKTLVREFHSTLSTMQWVTTGYGLAMAATIPLAGCGLPPLVTRSARPLTPRFSQ